MLKHYMIAMCAQTPGSMCLGQSSMQPCCPSCRVAQTTHSCISLPSKYSSHLSSSVD